MDESNRGVLIGLSSIIAGGAALHWVHHKSFAPMDFIERHLGFSPDDGDGSMEAILFTVVVMITTLAAFRLASKPAPYRHPPSLLLRLTALTP
jgi:hypothetical protein